MYAHAQYVVGHDSSAKSSVGKERLKNPLSVNARRLQLLLRRAIAEKNIDR